jgi:hypothetical protein
MKFKSPEHLNYLVDKHLGYKCLPHKIRNRMKKDILKYWVGDNKENTFCWLQMFNPVMSVLKKKSICSWKRYI